MADRSSVHPPGRPGRSREPEAMADLVLIALIIAVFAVLGLVVRAVERL
ncbi:hypothetical protein DFJ69_0430 [Thermomonospora umbrina]|uniref:Uncharacterized protein n=1 Tax=Thermomonospora umbrina TaxID=111806 RepID=A0A3D9SMA0_9ACTN|nr:hypothetical protein DFJ69_0430 [Thermomonospora umbrina]